MSYVFLKQGGEKRDLLGKVSRNLSGKGEPSCIIKKDERIVIPLGGKGGEASLYRSVHRGKKIASSFRYKEKERGDSKGKKKRGV